LDRVYITVDETAELTGLKENSVFYNIKRGKYETVTIPGKGRGGKQYLIALDSLPKEAQERYKKQQSTPAPLKIFSEEVMKRYYMEQREKVVERYNILVEW